MTTEKLFYATPFEMDMSEFAQIDAIDQKIYEVEQQISALREQLLDVKRRAGRRIPEIFISGLTASERAELEVVREKIEEAEKLVARGKRQRLSVSRRGQGRVAAFFDEGEISQDAAQAAMRHLEHLARG